VFSDAKETLVKSERRKIVFVKVESSVTRNICKRSLIQTLRRYKFNKRLGKLLLGSQGTVNQTTSCQHIQMFYFLTISTFKVLLFSIGWCVFNEDL